MESLLQVVCGMRCMGVPGMDDMARYISMWFAKDFRALADEDRCCLCIC